MPEVGPTASRRRRHHRVNGKVSRALKPYHGRLASDSHSFTEASLKLARASVGQQSFNQLSPEATAALAALAKWQRDVRRARRKVEGVSSRAAGQKLAVEWLTSLGASLGFMNQSLSLTDPQRASDAANRARRSLRRSHELADSLARVIA